ncbi:hypothetical protein GCM10011273_16980 [Asticcacaulis endophyticus]|uniref:Uncharacterized protein n=1 Tax=Asticcacaulis endophyticus TaxID=1395890 RepID=A0A918Q299_9CAUL|nr:hypothetical protein GCM10011273_16980 [Asticcacaulis endophyticus]
MSGGDRPLRFTRAHIRYRGYGGKTGRIINIDYHASIGIAPYATNQGLLPQKVSAL